MIALVLFVAVASAVVPAGTPYLAANVSFTGTFSQSDLKQNIAKWFVANSIIPTAQETDIILQDSLTLSAGVLALNLSLGASFDNVKGIDAWNAIAEPMKSGAVLPVSTYSVSAAVPYENPATNVVVSFNPMLPGYNYSWATFSVQLSTTPRHQKTIALALSANSSNVEFDVTSITLTYPARSGTFRMRAPLGGYAINVSLTSGGSDDITRYSINTTQSTWTVGYRLNVTIDAPSTETYAGADSDVFGITAPIHRDRVIDLIVTVVPSSTALTVFPANVSIPGRNIRKLFFVVGAAGVYNLTYVIAPPWNTGSGWKGLSNTDFYQPTTVTSIYVHPPLNITVAPIPRGYLVSTPQGSWGGAFSQPVIVRIEKPPRVILELIPSGGSNDVEFIPTKLVFLPGAQPFQRLVVRALTPGFKTISFTRSGADMVHYADPASRLWIVTGKNKNCYLAKTAVACWNLPGCQWDAMKNWCSNSTLTPLLSRVPDLFDQEQTLNITLTLPTAVRNSLVVSFVALQRLSFTPSSLTFAAGERQKNFTITASLNQGDGRVRQAFRLALSGEDANAYTQVDAWANIRPKVTCEVIPPSPFFVGTDSDPFSLICDTDPETDVTFTPKPVLGLALIPIGGVAGDGAKMTPGVYSARFTVSSTGTNTGSFVFELVIGGTNAPRYSPIQTVSIQVLPSGEVLPPPKFYLTAFDLSPFFHIDVTVQAPSILEVTVNVETLAGNPTGDAFVFPTLLKYNNSRRNVLRAIGFVPGSYRLTFSISGINKKNYVAPQPLPFEVKPRLDGKAFEARSTVGFLPPMRCRVAVGRQSLAFKGQDPIDGMSTFCSDLTIQPKGTTFNCSIHATEERCRNELSSNGNICVWHQNNCQFLPTMQGYVKMVSYGSGFTVLLTTDGRIFSIGSTKYGQLGHYNDYLTEVPMPENITAISSGTSHTIALSMEGRLYSWGANYKGQLGQATRVKQTATVGRVVFPKGENISCISSGTLHSGALALSGKVFMWGSNEYGQLGNEPSYRSIALAPQAINREYFDGEPAVALQCGEYHTVVATSIEAYTFGSNTMGQLGRDAFDDWKPAPPVLWTKNPYNTQPLYPGWVTGRGRC